MEEIKERARKMLRNGTENPKMEWLVQRWSKKINSLPNAKLRQLSLWKELDFPLEEGVKLAKRLSRIKTKYDFRVSELVFKMNYKAEYGWSGVIIGSPEIIGKWSPLKSYKMTWTEGHNWRAAIPISQLGTEFEYKYAIQDLATKSIKKWENCSNRRLSIQDIELYLDRAEVAPFVSEVDEYHFEYKGVRMTYIKDKEVLIMHDYWQS